MSKYLEGLTQIGYYVLPEPATFTRHYECAAWYTNIEVPAGKYPVYAKVKNGKVDYGHDAVRVELPGVISGSNFTSRLGAHYGTPKIDEDKGRPETYRFSTHGYCIAREILDGTNRNWELFPEYQARVASYEYVTAFRDGTYHPAAGFTTSLEKVS